MRLFPRGPDPKALAAGLSAERVGRAWRYHDPILRAHLQDRHAKWGKVSLYAAGSPELQPAEAVLS